MIQTNETHNKIIQLLEKNGPSLPVQISKQIGLNSLFISAFLSELLDSKMIKVSHLKVGGSPLYFLEGQEKQLEPYYKYLHPREAETFLFLKKHKLLKDSEQDPAIRVALRSIRDFAIGFKKQEEIYWRYYLISDQEIRDLLKPKKEKSKKSKTTDKPTTSKQEIPKPKPGFTNPLAKKQEKPKKQKQKSEFVLRTINFIQTNNLQIIEEKEYKAKEYNCLTQINSQLGPITFLTQAKDKKSITKKDFEKLLSQAQSIPLPALIIYSGEISKNAVEYLKKYSSILKAIKLS